jgi:response regulator RpfG family c-di-GMP phosphodiesterase
MAFGKIDEDLLSDIALAGLLHDIGMTQLPYQLAQTPWEMVRSEQIPDYLTHSSYSVDLSSEFAPELSARVRSLIQTHHASFADAKEVSPIRDMAQLVALADRVDSMCNGLWDGRERTVLEALLTLEVWENQAGEFRQFKSEVFMAILRWIRGQIPDYSLQQAISAVEEQLRVVRERAS